jgi:hypothetical protein
LRKACGVACGFFAGNFSDTTDLDLRRAFAARRAALMSPTKTMSEK